MKYWADFEKELPIFLGLTTLLGIFPTLANFNEVAAKNRNRITLKLSRETLGALVAQHLDQLGTLSCFE